MQPSSNMKRVLLAVLAHPDDETFGTGGTLALYAQRGVEVYLVCATQGEVGEVAPELMEGFNSVAERRVSELRCAAGVLGLAGIQFLGYRDSGMSGSPDNDHPQALAAAPPDEVASQVAHIIRQLRPQVVLTFDPIGGYKHPDHIACHKATVEAFHKAGDASFVDDFPPFQPNKLYFHVMPKGLMRFAVRILPLFRMDARHFGRNGDIDLVALVQEGDFPVHAEIDVQSVQQLREAASACHASQLEGGMQRRGPVTWLMRWFGGKEQYMRAYPQAERGLHERDLFAGISEGS